MVPGQGPGTVGGRDAGLELRARSCVRGGGRHCSGCVVVAACGRRTAGVGTGPCPGPWASLCGAGRLGAGSGRVQASRRLLLAERVCVLPQTRGRVLAVPVGLHLRLCPDGRVLRGCACCPPGWGRREAGVPLGEREGARKRAPQCGRSQPVTRVRPRHRAVGAVGRSAGCRVRFGGGGRVAVLNAGGALVSEPQRKAPPWSAVLPVAQLPQCVGEGRAWPTWPRGPLAAGGPLLSFLTRDSRFRHSPLVQLPERFRKSTSPRFSSHGGMVVVVILAM